MKKILVALMLCSLILCGMGYRDDASAEPEDYGAVNDGIEPCWSYNGLHAGCFVVIGVERDENDYDMVTIQATNGNIFQFYAYGSDWCVGDGCVCIMSDNGTPEIADDIILTAGYACF